MALQLKFIVPLIILISMSGCPSHSSQGCQLLRRTKRNPRGARSEARRHRCSGNGVGIITVPARFDILMRTGGSTELAAWIWKKGGRQESVLGPKAMMS
ncbi:phosphatidylglycerol/phosphatidylinositol transfer protein [Pyrus ussuriensis x Pyrus communis]|uniref:Phosphatidylglycerol/phosphatidylinositol transfer protein n=1 Tax=Pyrus ussuriensis x Pyrus communis TaxID=2448454 RepID=A0A5N5ICC4_9ROSA|nr:phosphatidylglycerol/phosphatidylinositol transfer protein [Pyrus ussuriensis x Pyrus communis]